MPPRLIVIAFTVPNTISTPASLVPVAVPPATTSSRPAAFTVVPLAPPPLNTISEPPLLTTVLRALPPARMFSNPAEPILAPFTMPAILVVSRKRHALPCVRSLDWLWD